MKKLTKAQDGIISKKQDREMARGRRLAAREDRQIKTKKLVDQGTFTPKEGRMLRRAAAQQFREEERKRKQNSETMKKGGTVSKMKKYDDGGIANQKKDNERIAKGPRQYDPLNKKTAMTALGVTPKKEGKYAPSNFAPIPTTGSNTPVTGKGVKPKGMYGMSMKPGMMKKGGAKKK